MRLTMREPVKTCSPAICILGYKANSSKSGQAAALAITNSRHSVQVEVARV